MKMLAKFQVDIFDSRASAAPRTRRRILLSGNGSRRIDSWRSHKLQNFRRNDCGVRSTEGPLGPQRVGIPDAIFLTEFGESPAGDVRRFAPFVL